MASGSSTIPQPDDEVLLISTGTHPTPPVLSESSLLNRIPTMEIDDLFALLRKNELPPDAPERRLIQARVDDYKMQADLKRYKRVLERDSEEETEPDKKPKVDFKYTNLERLTPKTTLRGFADWKADMTNLFIASLSQRCWGSI
jgi:hypothetical protein